MISRCQSSKRMKYLFGLSRMNSLWWRGDRGGQSSGLGRGLEGVGGKCGRSRSRFVGAEVGLRVEMDNIYLDR